MDYETSNKMELTLEIVSYHRLSPEQVKVINVGNVLSLGRSETCDWHMPDPDKVVSGKHAQISKRNDGFYIEDLSTNGLFINRAVEALGSGAAHKIEHEDLLTFGDYEVSAKLISATDSAHNGHMSAGVQQSNILPAEAVISSSEPAFNNDFNNDITGFDAQELLGKASSNSALLSEVNADLQDHFKPPESTIPEEWDKDFFEQKSTPAATPTVAAKPLVETPRPQAAPQAQVKPVARSTPRTTPAQEANTQVQPVTSLTQAFFKGLGVDEQDYGKVLNESLMLELGQSMHLMLTGLMDSLRQRSQLKMEFRINQTTFQQRENNPLKFSANIDDVFQNLFLRNSASFLSSQQAITEAFNDGRKHDIALTAGTIGALQGLLNELDPQAIEQKSQSQTITDMLPGQKQTRQWKVYKSLHQDYKNEFMRDNSAALSDDFVKAYDSKLKLL